MIEIEMSKNIKEYAPKTMGIFTTRQIVCLIIGAAAGIAVGAAVPASTTIKIIVGIIVSVPALLCGWVKIYDVPLEKFFFRDILPVLTNPQKRIYRSENTWAFLEGKPETEEAPKVKKSKEFAALK